MQSFRTEIENPVVEKDIIELAQKIEQFKEGKSTKKNSEACVSLEGSMDNANKACK